MMYLPDDFMPSGLDWVTVAAVCSALWSIICRVNALQARRTKLGVFLQHVVLALGLLGLVLLEPNAAKATMAVAVALYLLIGAKRWKHGAPEGTNKPQPGEPPQQLPDSLMGDVWGRGRE